MIDETDKKIISELQEDGRKSLSSIARKLGQSPVSIWKRLQKLTKSDRIKISVNVNTKELFPKTAIIEAEVKNYETISKLILKYKDCPRLIFISSFGGSSIVTILVGENLPTLKSCVGSCSVRIEEGIRRSEVKIGDHPPFPNFLPVKISFNSKTEISPCGIRCDKCLSYKERKCLGCPATKYYRTD